MLQQQQQLSMLQQQQQQSKLCDMQDYAEYQQDYVIQYTILHYMVYNISCYVMQYQQQYQKQYQKHDTTYRSTTIIICMYYILTMYNSVLHRISSSIHTAAQPYNCIAVSVRRLRVSQVIIYPVQLNRLRSPYIQSEATELSLQVN